MTSAQAHTHVIALAQVARAHAQIFQQAHALPRVAQVHAHANARAPMTYAHANARTAIA